MISVVGLSKFHFHRIFYSFAGEALYGFINRLRLEKAASILLTQNININSTAFLFGFTDSATFSRSFKKYFGVPASKWIKKKNSKNDQDFGYKLGYAYVMDIEESVKPLYFEERQIPDMWISYIHHTGSYDGNGKLFYNLYKTVMNWATFKGIENLIKAKLRISVGLTVLGDVSVGGKIGKLYVSGGKYMLCRFILRDNEYGKAWTYVYRHILPQKSLQPNDGTALRCTCMIAMIG